VSVVVLLGLLVTWLVTAGGGGGRNDSGDSNGKNPAPSITPGPSDSGPAISQHPGGRDESGSGDGSGGSGDSSGSDGTDGGDSAGTGGGGAGSDAGSGGSGDGSGADAGPVGGSGSAGGSTVGTGDTVPVGTSLPNCTSSAVRLTLHSVHNSYEQGQRPRFQLTARNSSGTDCKVDLGPKHAVLTITQAGGDSPYWSSDDCPETAGSLVFRVPANSAITYNVEWDRKPSSSNCATPPAGSAKGGTYLVEMKTAGFEKAQTSFVLQKD
jgi:hypothetical protein